MKRSKCKSWASWLIEMTKIEMRAAPIVKGKSLALQKQVLFPILRNYTFKAQFSKQHNRRDEVNIFFVIYVQLLAGRLNTFLRFRCCSTCAFGHHLLTKKQPA